MFPHSPRLRQELAASSTSGAPVAEAHGDCFKDAAESRPSHGILRRGKYVPPKNDGVGEKKSIRGQPPCPEIALMRLIACRHVRALVAVHFHRDEKLVMIAPAADFRSSHAVQSHGTNGTHRADVKQDGLVLALARAKASVPHSYQSTCWCHRRSQIGLANGQAASDFSFTASFPDARCAAAAVLVRLF